MKRLIAALLSAGACGFVGAGLAIVDGSARAAASTTQAIGIQDDYVQTPAGLYHRSCVHEVASGAVVDRRLGMVMRRDGSSYQLPTCLYPPRGVLRLGTRQPPADNGWMEWASVSQPAGSYSALNASWTVPNAPFVGGQLFYTFPGLQSSAYIIQPVLQYGDNGSFGGSSWSMASWHCNTGSDCIHSTPLGTQAGRSMYGSVAASNCSGGNCTWTITTQDDAGAQTTLTVVDTQNYYWATGGAVEVYNIGDCNQYPANGLSYSGISLFDQNGTQVSPSWSHNVQSNANPWCAFSMSSSATNVNFQWYALDLGIAGPTHMPPGETCSWNAQVFSGQAPFSYSWDQTSSDGAFLNLSDPSAASVTGTSSDPGNVTLTLTVTDAAGVRGSVSRLVQIREFYTSCS
jgi:hypothetical protein